MIWIAGASLALDELIQDGLALRRGRLKIR